MAITLSKVITIRSAVLVLLIPICSFAGKAAHPTNGDVNGGSSVTPAVERDESMTSVTAGSRSEQQRTEFNPIMINDGDGVRNGGFEQWLAGKPLFWNWLERYDAFVAKSEEASEGRFAVTLNPGYDYLFVFSRVELFGPVAGKTLVLSVWAKSSDPKTAYIAIGSEGEEKAVFSGQHPGDGQWHRMEVTYKLAKDDVSRSFRLELKYGHTPKRPCYYDNVRVEVRE